MSDFISEKMPQKKYYRDVPLRDIDSNQSMYSLIKNINDENLDLNAIGYMNHNYTYEEVLRNIASAIDAQFFIVDTTVCFVSFNSEKASVLVLPIFQYYTY